MCVSINMYYPIPLTGTVAYYVNSKYALCYSGSGSTVNVYSKYIKRFV